MKFKHIIALGDDDLYALSEDGEIYKIAMYREILPDTIRNEYGAEENNWRIVRFWEKVEYPIGDPRQIAAIQSLPETEIQHLFTDEEVVDMKAKGLISTEPIPVPASNPGICAYCGNPTGDDTSQCNDCAIPF